MGTRTSRRTVARWGYAKRVKSMSRLLVLDPEWDKDKGRRRRIALRSSQSGLGIRSKSHPNP